MNRSITRQFETTDLAPPALRNQQRISFWPLILIAALLLLLVLPDPTLAVAPGVKMEYDLGKPCYETRSERPSRDESNELNAKLNEALETKNWSRAVELQKERVRYWCWDARRWLDLAKYHLRGGNDTESLNILTELYENAPNWFEQRLGNEWWDFPANISNSPTYKGSALHKIRKQDMREWRRRQNRFRKQLANLPEDEKPSNPYVARDVCPFECCTYRTWSVHEPVPLYEKPQNDTQIASLDEGDTVEALTGNVYLQPEPVGVVHDLKLDRETTVPAGEIVFVLDSMGEGYSRILYQGETYPTSTYHLRTRCPRPDGRCWGEYLNPLQKTRDWWVKLRTPEGRTAWTNRLGFFGNMDTCG